MGIISKTVKVKVGSRNFKYYKNLGYNFNHIGDEIDVKISDLPKTSKVKVIVRCDICNKKEMLVEYGNYNVVMNKTGSYVCKDCAPIKQIQTIEKIYNCSNISQNEDIKIKKKETSLRHFGVEHPMKSDIVKDKLNNSIYNKYGVKNISQDVNVQKKKIETSLRKFGTEYPMQNNELKEHVIRTNIEKYKATNPMKNEVIKNILKQSFMGKYGVEYPLQIPEAREKFSRTVYLSGNTASSKQQIYIFNLYKSVNQTIELNYPISFFNVDICFLEEKLAIEYDGGGHGLRVILGKLTKEEFEQKELVRNKVIKRAGYKQMRIISNNDNLPSDKKLLEILDYTRNYFSNYPNHSWIEFNIDSSAVHSAEYEDGVFFDYGVLRKIK